MARMLTVARKPSHSTDQSTTALGHSIAAATASTGRCTPFNNVGQVFVEPRNEHLSKLIKQIKCWDRMKPNAFPKMMCRILEVDVPTATVLNLLVDCLESLAEDEGVEWPR
jgi:hypothetical protein